MKIQICIGTLTAGGAERVVSILSREFVEQGHEVEILLYYDRPIHYDIDSRVKITIEESYIKKSYFSKRNTLSHMIWHRRYVKKEKPDVIISFLAPFNMVNIVAMAGLKIPLIVADRNDPSRVPEKRVIRLLRDFLYRFANGIVLQSENNRRYFPPSVREKSVVIYNPIDLGKYAGAAINTNKEKNIVFVGRIIKQKNPLMLLEAFSNISKDFPEYKLIYYGEGDMRDTVFERAKELDLENKVYLPGAVKNVFKYIYRDSLYVMTSEYEGMPNALLEAMCIGLPVISTKVSGATDVINNGENGMLIDCGSVYQLTKAMQKMLSDQYLRERSASEATKLTEKLSISEISNCWMTFITKIVCEKRGKTIRRKKV
jgi:GalNAc-alpha-(1->4)-GalNAc-alpha-(1->3)-diNAcBac-PP-undecaprenol alpha-1,4-N-acetyl-D-galactosaminyltransferase